MKVTSERTITSKVVVEGKPGEHLDATALESLGRYKSVFVIKTNGHLVFRGFATVDIGKWSRLVTLAGGKVEIYGGRFVGRGHAIHGDYGSLCKVRNITHEKRLWKYSCYLNDYLSGNPTDELMGIDIDGLAAPFGSESEAIVRMMGGSGTLKGLRLDNSSNTYGKEAIQLRHGTVTLSDSNIIGSASIGRLDPATTGAVYAKYKSASATLRNVQMSGYIQATGDPWLRCESVKFIAKDPRGIGPNIAITNKSYAGFPPATISVDSGCSKGPFLKLV